MTRQDGTKTLIYDPTQPLGQAPGTYALMVAAWARGARDRCVLLGFCWPQTLIIRYITSAN